MIFDSESVFEDNVITVLKQHGWKDGVLRYPTEQDLLDNWKGILYRNNNDIDRLGKYPLTDGEMAQITSRLRPYEPRLRSIRSSMGVPCPSRVTTKKMWRISARKSASTSMTARKSQAAKAPIRLLSNRSIPPRTRC